MQIASMRTSAHELAHAVYRTMFMAICYAVRNCRGECLIQFASSFFCLMFVCISIQEDTGFIAKVDITSAQSRITV